jgi:hypothetical protein
VALVQSIALAGATPYRDADSPVVLNVADRPTHGTPSSQPTFTLIGASPRDLLGEGPLPSADLPDVPSEFPETTQTDPVAIPFPTAVHLFIPGAIMAIYATRRFRGRRR